MLKWFRYILEKVEFKIGNSVKEYHILRHTGQLQFNFYANQSDDQYDGFKKGPLAASFSLLTLPISKQITYKIFLLYLDCQRLDSNQSNLINILRS